jgi:hypothetical protein
MLTLTITPTKKTHRLVDRRQNSGSSGLGSGKTTNFLKPGNNLQLSNQR